MDEIGYATNSNANLDLFCQLVRDINKNDLITFLNRSWNLNQLKTIAIIFNCRDRLNGKKEKNISNFCLLWLKLNHSQIYKKNLLTYIDKYGCWNDLNFIIDKTKHHNYEYKVFAEQLKKDKISLDYDENISLCAKWVISANNTDSIKIARYLFDDITNFQEKYRKEYITPLRKKLNIIETKLCKKDWEYIDYSKIPAKALNVYKKSFIRNDYDKYYSFLNEIKNYKNYKITGLLPHEIIKKYIDSDLNDIDETLELQWQTFINFYKDKIIDSIIPIIDVSGSMFTFNKLSIIKPIYVSIAIGLLLAEINSDFLHNKIMTFSEFPIFINIEGDTLKDKIKCILQSNFGLNTNFLKVADLIISTSLTNPSFNYKKIICITDMQFDKNNISTDTHSLFINKFINSNSIIPELIYWNVSGSYSNFPINNDYTNISIISGFSEQLLSIILDCDKLTPEILMNKVLEPYYSNIVI